MALLLVGCNTFGELERGHPFGDCPAECVRVADQCRCELSDGDADAGTPRVPDAQPDVSQPPNPCDDPAGQDECARNNPPNIQPGARLDLSRFVVVIADEQALQGQCDPSTDPGNPNASPGPEIAGLRLTHGPNAQPIELGTILIAEATATSDEISVVLGQPGNAQCPAFAALGCGGYFAVQLRGEVAADALLTLQVDELGPECNLGEDAYIAAVCSINGSLDGQQCDGVILTLSSQGRESFEFSAEQLAAF